MKKIKLLLIIFLMAGAWGNRLFAQQGLYDVIYLKNGSIINGVITEQVPGQTIKVETRDKNVFVFREDEIEKIVKAGILQKHGKDEILPTPEAKVYSVTEPYTGYTFGVETGIGPGINGQNGMTLAPHIINGVAVNSKFSFGLGLGFDLYTIGYYEKDNSTYYDDYASTYLNVSYFLDLRAFPVNGKISPLIVCELGYGTTMYSSKVTGGLYVNSGVGTRFKFTNKFGLNLSLNYKIQKFTYKDDVYTYNYYYPYNYQYKNVNEKFTLEYMNLVIGLSF
jgi:hypothetical protein